MPTTTVVHLMRHGEVYNPDRVLYGRLPHYHLSDRGHDMARLTAKWFEGRDVATVLSSPLDRTRETAAPLASAFDLDVEIDDRLIEPVNVFEGQQFSSRSLIEPQTWARVYNPFRPSWGEPYTDVVKRMVAVVKDARRAAWGQEAVCVSHQAPIWLLRRAAERKRLWHRPDRRQCNLASVTTLTFVEYHLVSVGYTEPAASLYSSQ